MLAKAKKITIGQNINPIKYVNNEHFPSDPTNKYLIQGIVIINKIKKSNTDKPSI